MGTTASVDLSDYNLWRDGFPDEVFTDLRRNAPVFHHEMNERVEKMLATDFWVTTKHAHAQRIHRDIDSFTAVDGPLIQDMGTFSEMPTLINMDPPELNKRRRVIASAFTPKAIAKLEHGIRTRAATMVDALLEKRDGDWIDDVADALPMSVIADIIGMPEEDRPKIYDCLDRILKSKAPEFELSEEDQIGLYTTIFEYAKQLTAEKRAHPADDIWSTLASAVITDEDGQELSLPSAELEIFFFVLALAGSDTTKNALAMGLQAYVENPDQLARYHSDESVRQSAVEEVLRWSTPVTYWTRTTKVDIELDGQHIPKGERVVAMLRSANRDEDVFTDPFRFDIGRESNPHVTFGGGGPHHCLGAMLARAEIRAVFDELLPRIERIELGEPSVANPSLISNMFIYDKWPITVVPR